MKINQKLLSIASLIVLVGLFGVAAQASEQSRESACDYSGLVLGYIVEKVPADYEAWYRQQLAKYWNKDFIAVERRKETTPETVRLMKLAWHRNASVGGQTDHGIDAIQMPSKLSLWFAYLLNIIDGKESQFLAHEYVHFAKHGADVPVNNGYLEAIRQCFPQNLPVRCLLPEVSDDKDQAVVSHSEFFCELKSLELLEQHDNAAYQAFLRSQYKKYLHSCPRDETYPNAPELLLLWSLYKKAKENRYSGSSLDDIMHAVIDDYLASRDCYKRAMAQDHFLWQFERERPKLSLDERIIAGVTGGLLGGTITTALMNGSNKAGLALFALSYTLLSAVRILKPADVRQRLSTYDLFWDHGKFVRALDHDSARIAETVKVWTNRSKKLDGMKIE